MVTDNELFIPSKTRHNTYIHTAVYIACLITLHMYTHIYVGAVCVYTRIVHTFCVIEGSLDLNLPALRSLKLYYFYLHYRWFISGLGEWEIVLDRCYTPAH